MKSVKRPISLILVLTMLLLSYVSFVYAVETDEAEDNSSASDISNESSNDAYDKGDPGKYPVEILAKSAVLMDLDSGKVIMEKNPHEQLFPASVTKVMTMLLIMEAVDSGKISLSDKVTTSTEASQKGGSQVFLKEGEVMTVNELLKAIAVHSANDASAAMAEFIAGSEAEFVNLMNQRAKELSMKNTNFENCSGLDDTADNHKTTAYDIALMSMELMKHEKIMEYTTIYMDSLRNGETELVNTNKLVRFYEGTTGLKTGTTSKAGSCISATAKRNGTHLAAVVMGSNNSSDRFETAKAMLNWGFANYETVKLEIDKKLITDVRVLKGTQDILTPKAPDTESILIPKGQGKNIVSEVSLPVDVEAPVEKNQVIGKITLKLGDEIVGEYNLCAPDAVEKRTFSFAFKKIFMSIVE